jgi:UDP-N-acetylglucosamine--N-acetylmuramyl-(pentapeptide) pyrophosphoryl-undecaprenol N-acetylglucosamine transferase
MNQAGRLAVVAAGGTGGHLFPAQALAEALMARGWRIVLATDERGAQFADKFPAQERIGLSAATFRRGDPVGMARAGLRIGRGVLQARAAFARLKPAVVVGFGGYPSLPAMIAAFTSSTPTVIHEQNAVIGRANRFLAARASAVACAFPTLLKAPPAVKTRAIVVGNPVRPAIRALTAEPYRKPARTVHLLITGGSQGSRLLSELPPAAVQLLPEALRAKLKVHQQTRPDCVESARRVYAEALVEAETAPFFRDMATRLGQAHLVIGRAGASTCCELAVAGKPAILVPLKIALDDDQGQNARLLAEAGAAEIISEDELTTERLADTLTRLLSQPAELAKMAAAARSVAVPDAAEKLADLVESTAASAPR